MHWKKWTVIAVGTLFMIGNLYLTYKKDTPIKRLSFIDTWTNVKEQNLVESKADEGLITPVEEEYIYYEEKTGDFEAFLVKEGEAVEENTPIIELSSVNIDAEITKRKQEISRLEDEITAVEDNIDSLDDLLSQINRSTTEENKASNEIMANSLEIQIYEKEMQLSTLEAELKRQKNALASIDDSRTNLTLNTTISGKVKEIRHDLNNPVVTITSDELQVEGTLTEKEFVTFTEGMKVTITSHLLKDKLEGSIASISTLPKATPSMKKETQYTYTIAFNEKPDATLLLGSHVDLKIITNEIIDALTVSTKAVQDKGTKAYIYVMMANGTIQRRKVETGLKLDHVYELKSGAEEEELVVLTANTLKNKTKFFTALEAKKINKKAFKEMGKKKALKTALKGFVS